MALNLNLDPFWRSSVGFDRIFDLMDSSLRFQPEDSYPPYNIVRTGEIPIASRSRLLASSPTRSPVTVGSSESDLVVAIAIAGDHEASARTPTIKARKTPLRQLIIVVPGEGRWRVSLSSRTKSKS
jgi:HSP20 family molecular chaperone IbpA